MKKIFSLFTGALLAISALAQESDVIMLSASTYNEAKTTELGGQDWYFNDTEVYLNMSGRKYKEVERQGWNNGLNFKNNTQYTIKLGNVKAYRIEFAGFSLGDNWDYLYAYGVGDAADGYEWVDPIGQYVLDNQTIIDQAQYPLDPCETTMDTPVFNKAGYTWASLDFSDEPYEGTFPFIFSGNNQEQCLIRIYTTPESAAAAANSKYSFEVSTYDAEKTAEMGGQDWYFKNTDMYLNMSGRSWKEVDRQGWNEGLNFKNNTKYAIQLGSNKLYRIEFSGFSLGDNWDYLYAYGVGDAEDGYEWVDPIGQGVKDNITIIEQAAYPLDPCETNMDAPIFYKAGYTWAAIDFADEPYEGTFPFFFSGNNQEQTKITVYLTRAAADEAEAVYVKPVYDLNDVENVFVNSTTNTDIYNIFGQKVDENYKGIVIMGGMKFFRH